MSEVPVEGGEQSHDPFVLALQDKFKPLRIWLPVLMIAVMAVLWLTPRVYADAPIGLQITAAMAPLACGTLIMLWWVLLSRASMVERLVGLVGTLAALGATYLLVDKSMHMPAMLLMTIPMGTLAFAAGAIVYRQALSFRRTLVALLLATLGFGFSTLLRSEGMWGEFAALELYWRWQSTPEEQLLARQAGTPQQEAVAFTTDQFDQWLTSPEWSGFRGADRTGQQHGPPLSTDWSAAPPELIWKIPVGPGWSSFTVAGNLLYTQEQRGSQEMVVCYTADAGREVWQQAVETRFYEAMGGAGPRATPTLSGGKLFAMGASGHLLRLDPKTGDVLWQADLRTVAERDPPTWGFSSSPLVVGSLVVVHAGGKDDKGVLAFDVETGQLSWSTASGDHSYSSPQLSTIAGEELILMQTNDGVILIDPETGKERLFCEWSYEGYRVLQPQVVDRDSVLLATGMGNGTRRVRITNTVGHLAAEILWTSKHLKPDFNDMVVHQNHAYGFDVAIFTCIDLSSGKRTWKGGRYGKGQVLLLADANLLLVASEYGEVVLLAANPDKRQELARFTALEGKTWNHPVVVGDRLYIRNAQEAACYRLPLASEEVARR